MTGHPSNRLELTTERSGNGIEPRRLSSLRPGRVSLVGAGPGDPELLTVKALNRIRAARAIVHDALVSAETLAFAPEGCLLFDVGKRSGDPHSAKQGAIEALLAELARSGLDVVRLKGGDPFVFGRGGEEAAYLGALGISVEVIPGVSSVNAAAAAAAIPLTQRGLSAAFTVLNGHGPDLDRIDWNALVALGGTWVFLMARDSVLTIARSLVAHGADPELPLALIQDATLPNQSVWAAPLALAAAGGVPVTGGGPGLVIIGPTAGAALRRCYGVSTLELHARTLPDLLEARR